ncbi:Gfo/Idh/MocA family protein [Ornithinimicrobium cerasi]|uniref:Predicted dehydrogenase n=1 Tax=Ornithinimicrobium cerasi TaxID=2248773 RepID=A0A285VMN9_9MICO|nr:Gfo/Idh/MocA family oxidoreductase [Ornithinimicrobium cerasi]SOC55167.1 Predicted dehydrogenase [Ornithinimicrobium cerasi]
MDLQHSTSPVYPPLVDRPVRWGLLAAGGIARAFAEAVQRSTGGRVVAVAARDGGRARAFAERHGIERSYGSYHHLYVDEDVDAVYISSTHPFHTEQALACIAAGKHVMVEKPVALTVAGAEAIFEAARARRVLAMEAMWTRCLPVVRDVVTRVRRGDIGTVRSFSAAFTVPFPYDEKHRLFDLENGGGALLDIGVYPVTLAHLLVGHPTDLQVLGSTAPTGADDLAALQWMTREGGLVQVLCDSRSHGASRTVVRGTQGWIEVHGPVNDPESFTLHRGHDSEWVDGPRHHFLHEVDEFHRCLRSGLVESPLVPHADTVAIMTILESARRELGVRYPQEEEPLHT